MEFDLIDFEQLHTELENKNFNKLKEILIELQVADIAEFLNEVTDNLKLITIFKLLPKDLGAEVFSYIDSNIQEELIKALTDSEIAYLIEEMFIDDAVDFIEEMPANIVERVLKNSSKDTRATINKMLRYDENSAGSVMTTEFLDLKEHFTVKDSLERIRKIGNNVEQINVLFVTDTQRVLKGVLSIKDLLMQDEDVLVKDIMDDNVVYETTSCDKEIISQMFSKYDILVMPICDNEKRLVGIVTIDDCIEIMEEEFTEDLSKMNAISPSDKPYLKTSVFTLWLNRVPWLLILMLSSSITALIITKNEGLLNQSVYGLILTACIPMIMGTGGNAGGQASATIIRGIALDEIDFSDILRVIWKEIRVSILLGGTLAIACFFKLLFLDGIINEANGVFVCLIICLSMFVTVILAKIVGAILPLLAKKCHLDPAVLASPFITTIIDAMSLLILCALSLNFLM